MRMLLLACMAYLAGCSHLSAISEAPRPPDQGRAVWLLQRVKMIADQGIVLDRDAVFDALSLRVQKKIQNSTLDQEYYGCSEVNDFYIFDFPDWYRRTEEGIVETVGGGYMNPIVTILDSPYANYKHHEYSGCIFRNYEYKPERYKESQIYFSGVNAFSCIKANDIRSVLPSSEFNAGSEGYRDWSYVGKWDDYSKTTMTLVYGSQCITSITITQTELEGKRFKRALSRFLNCGEQVEKRFCEGREPFSRADPQFQELQAATAAGCKSLERYQKAEPWSGEMPLPAPHPWKGEYCRLVPNGGE
ncbi:hypothetical protein [Azospirillum sp. B4]|uniref:hypothetical protein n=1 Tax=Azospirillum sp. B4 TaxID=95605 RepID=UPI0011DCA394|nr:hypothetical protein [Azospirillum sp. B4]